MIEFGQWLSGATTDSDSLYSSAAISAGTSLGIPTTHSSLKGKISFTSDAGNLSRTLAHSVEVAQAEPQRLVGPPDPLWADRRALSNPVSRHASIPSMVFSDFNPLEQCLIRIEPYSINQLEHVNRWSEFGNLKSPLPQVQPSLIFPPRFLYYFSATSNPLCSCILAFFVYSP